jgi:hypothetical protein
VRPRKATQSKRAAASGKALGSHSSNTFLQEQLDLQARELAEARGLLIEALEQ